MLDSVMTSKEYVVLLPGTLCDERVFKNQIALFPQHEVLDLRHSSSIDEMIDVVSAVSVQKFHLIGFSMGGHIAQEFALRYPERIHRLVIIASSSLGYPVEEKKRVLSALDRIEKGKFDGISDKRLHDYLYSASYEKEDLRQLIHDMSGTDAKEVYLRQTHATLDRPDIKDRMNELIIPMMFIAGVNDQIVPLASVQESAENSPNAQFVMIKNCGHFVPLEQPEELNQHLINFLN